MSFSSLSFQNCDRDLTPIVESSKEKEEAKSDHEQSDEELGSARNFGQSVRNLVRRNKDEDASEAS